jgi:hypothetical protein
MWYIIIVPRESGSPKHLEKSLKKMKKPLTNPSKCDTISM